MRRLTRCLTGTTAVLAALGVLTACGADQDAADLSTPDAAVEGAAPERPEGVAEQGEAGGTADEPVADDETATGDADQPLVTAAGAVHPAPRDIIYTIDLVIETDDVGRAAARATALTEAAGGFVATETTRGDGSATLTLRVPTDRHAGLITELQTFGEVRERNRTTEDVTADITDLDARVASQRRSIERIRDLLDEASDLNDVVRIEAELASREAALDSLLQRREQLSNLTALATVTVTFYAPDEAADDDDDVILGFIPGLTLGWDALVASGRVAGTVIGAVLPFAVVGSLLGVPVWLAWRRFRPARAAQPGHATIEG